MNAHHSVATTTEARIGEVLKRLREQRGLSLRTLAGQVGFSPSFLSQVENGQVSPSLASLERMATELGVSLGGLFDASRPPSTVVVRSTERPGFTSTWSKARVESLTPAGERRPLDAILVTLEPKGTSGRQPSRHPTDQFAYVLAGRLTLSLDDETLTADPGDALMVSRTMPHRWSNDGPTPAQVLIVSPRLLP
jgi:transcriptional regulator with XRE-family HTH domain